MALGYLSEIFASFQGEGLHVGERHLFVRFGGCNLRCTYCDTPDSLERPDGYTVWAADGSAKRGTNPVSALDLQTLAAPFFEATALDAVAITGGEPLLQAGFLRDWLSEARFPVPILLETNGMLPGALERVLDFIDIVSMDVKLPSNSGEPAFWDLHASFAEIASRKRLYVKILVDHRTEMKDFERAVEIAARPSGSPTVFVQPIVDGEGKLLCAEGDLVRFHGAARSVLPTVRVVPQIHKFLGLR